MYTTLEYSPTSDMYPPPGSFRYNTPNPIRNGLAQTPSVEEDLKCLHCSFWIYLSWLRNFFHLRFWKIFMLVVFIVTMGHFSAVVMFRRIKEPLFVINDESPSNSTNTVIKKFREKPEEYGQTHHRKMNNLIPPIIALSMINSSSSWDKGSIKKGENINFNRPANASLNVPFSHSGNSTKPESSKGSSGAHKIDKIPEFGSREVQPNSSLPVTDLKLCPPVPPNLEGPVKVALNSIPSLEMQEKLHPELLPGGRFHPSECLARHKVAVIIPFRDRAAHLAVFLHNIHPFLQKQQIDYAIYIVEQAGGGKFNRAMLMNVGSIEALKLYPYDCFVFHDVDLIPEDDRNLYTCPVQPRHMSVAINTMKYTLPYNDIFGGVSAMTVDQFKKVNGFSNRFWGWGGEDDDMSNRIKFHHLYISRYPANVARYTMMSHKKDKPNPQRYKYLNEGKKRYSSDGLNLVKYKTLDLQLRKLYTWLSVELTKV